MRRELEDGGWFELKDLRHINYGEAKRLRNISAAGDEDAAEKAIVDCVVAWDLKDSRGEPVSDVSVDSLYRLAPATVAVIGEAVAKELAPAIPLPLKKE